MTGWHGRLTLRGIALVACGTACAVAAPVVGQQVLLFPATLLVLLPLGCWLVVRAGAPRLDASRDLPRDAVEAGGSLPVTIRLSWSGPAPGGPLLVAESLPDGFGPAPRRTLAGVGRGAQVDYAVPGARRGRWPLGPLRVEQRDPFGLTRVTATFPATDDFLVLPESLAVAGLAAHGTGGPGTPAQPLDTAVPDASIREYRAGDERRSIHWRSTARFGHMMVRRSEDRSTTSAVVALDCRPDLDAEAFERSVSRAAWWCRAQLDAGRAVLPVPGPGLTLAPEEPGAGIAAARALAGIEQDPLGWARIMDVCTARRRAAPTAEAPSVVVFTPWLDGRLVPLLSALADALGPRSTGTVVADTVAGGAAGGVPGLGATVPGWRVVDAGPGTSR